MSDDRAVTAPVRAVDVRTGHAGPDALLHVHVSWQWPDALVIAVGEIDAFTTPVLDRRFTEVLAGDPARVVLDASAVTFVSLAGVRILTTVGGELRDRGGGLVVVDPPPVLRTIVEGLRLQPPFEIARSGITMPFAERQRPVVRGRRAQCAAGGKSGEARPLRRP